MNNYWSRIPGFFKQSPEQRRQSLSALALEVKDEHWELLDKGLALEIADHMSENVVGVFNLPFSVAPNFVVDNQAVLVPLVTEEPSIVAALAKMAKLVALNGGFKTQVDESRQKGQVQVYGLADIERSQALLAQHKNELIIFLNHQIPNMIKRGGGVVDISWRALSSPTIGPMLIVEPIIDVKDAMGANIINTLMEALKPRIEYLLQGQVGLCILSNLCDTRMAHAQCSLSFRELALDSSHDFGEQVATRIIAAQAMAEVDIYRATTHNKGILNGIDAVAIATGNDFRALEAAAHAYASMTGSYGPLTRISIDRENKILHAKLSLPLAVGVVGDGLKLNNGVRVAHKILGSFVESNKKLASVMVSVGLAQCLAALMALCTDGIQKGHMALHSKKNLISKRSHAN
jgi:hydroxymethylglutaryl-CoA reductase